VRRLEQDVERALFLRAGRPLAWRRCQVDPERAQEPIPAGKRKICAPGIDPEATAELVWRVPRTVAARFHGVSHTLRSKLQPERRRLLAPGEAFDALLDCALVAWTARDPGCLAPTP